MLLVKEEVRLWPVVRYVGLNVVHSNVTLTLLFGVVKGVGMEKGPDKLAADVFQAELEMGMLVDGVMPAVEGSGANIESLLFGDFFRTDEAVGIARTGRRDG